MKFSGVFVATVTFFKGDGTVDLVSYRNHLEWLAEAGVDGFVPVGTTGEGSTLTDFERETIIECALEVARPLKKVVIAGCGTNDTKSTIKNVQAAEALGCDGALVVSPYYNKPTQAGLLAHYSAVAESSKLPIILYNVPGRTGVNISVDTVSTLLKNPRIVGIKEASGQYGQWVQMAQTISWADKSWLAGDDDAFAVTAAFGGVGIISATANVFPRAFVQMNKAIAEKNWEAAFALQAKVNSLVRAMFSETNPAPAKCALSLLRGTSPFVRLPLVEVQTSTRSNIESILKSLELGS